MTEKGIIFQPENIPKILSGQKTVTRRLGGLEKVNENPDEWEFDFQITSRYYQFYKVNGDAFDRNPCTSKYTIFDDLWLKEPYLGISNTNMCYKSDYPAYAKTLAWSNPIFMPKAYARPERFTVIDVRPVRLMSGMDESEARKEGFVPGKYTSAIGEFYNAWYEINPKYKNKNYWTWRIEFKLKER